MPICAHGLLTNLYIHSLFTMLFDKKRPVPSAAPPTTKPLQGILVLKSKVWRARPAGWRPAARNTASYLQKKMQHVIYSHLCVPCTI